MPIEINLVAIGKRIEELRGRLSQADFAGKLGVDRKTVGTWERGERLPDTKGLIGLWSEFDADPAWVLTGNGFAPSGTEDERELITLFRAAGLTGKAAAIGALQGAVGSISAVTNQQNVHGGKAHQHNAPRYTVQQIFNGPVGDTSSENITKKGKKKE